MTEEQMDELVDAFEALLYEYREVVVNHFIEEIASGDESVVDRIDTVNLIETDSVEYEFKERFCLELEEILGNG